MVFGLDVGDVSMPVYFDFGNGVLDQRDPSLRGFPFQELPHQGCIEVIAIHAIGSWFVFGNWRALLAGQCSREKIVIRVHWDIMALTALFAVVPEVPNILFIVF